MLYWQPQSSWALNLDGSIWLAGWLAQSSQPGEMIGARRVLLLLLLDGAEWASAARAIARAANACSGKQASNNNNDHYSDPDSLVVSPECGERDFKWIKNFLASKASPDKYIYIYIFS